ncbi:MAG: hypothetical protein ACRCUT_04245 [Spirochaetota bacterium]
MNIILIILLVAVLFIPLWALFSSGGEKDNAAPALPSEEQAFRRRSADKELEKTFPDEEKQTRRKEDRRRQADRAPQNELIPTEEDFSLPFTPKDVIPENSPFGIYQRTLKNAEVYMKKGDFDTARSIYEGVLDRVGDSDIRDRLEENLDYINNYHQILSKRNEVRRQEMLTAKPQEIRLTMEGSGNLAETLQTTLLQRPPVDVNEIVDKLSERLGNLAPDTTQIAENAVRRYKNDILQMRSELNEMSGIKEQLRIANEEQMRSDRAEAARLREELERIHAESETGTASPEDNAVSQQKLEEREAAIREDIRRREDENRILRDRMEIMQNDISRLRDEGSRSTADQGPGPDRGQNSEEIARLKSELSSMKEEIRRQAASGADAMKDLAGSMREAIDSLAPSLSDIARKGPAIPQNDDLEKMKGNIEALSPLLKENAERSKTESETLGDIAGAMKKSMDTLAPILKESAEKTKNGTDALGDIAGAMKESMESLAPILKDQAVKAEQELLDKKKEDEKKDDFQLIDEYIHGPKYDEPSDEDVMEKILNDAVKEQKKKDAAERKKEKKSEPENAVSEETKDEPEKKLRSQDRKKEKEEEDLKEDFELVSDYMRGPDEGEPTDEEVMEKILKDTMKPRDAGSRMSQGSPGRERGRDFPQPQKQRRELPILRVSYNFSRLPDEFTLSTDKNYLEFSFYKFKPLLEKAADLVKRRKVKDAVNYYKVVMDQDIPQEFKDMLGQNIKDLNEYLSKYYTTE